MAQQIELRSASGHAVVSAHGAQILKAELAGRPLLWLSPLATFDDRSAVRGGIPICFPWFGKHPDGLPAHGFARNRAWALVQQSDDRCVFELRDDADTIALWPHHFLARLTVTLSDALHIEFSVENIDSAPFTFTYALHSYLAVDQLAGVHVSGLDGRLRREVAHVTTPQAGDVTLLRATDAIFEHAPPRLTMRDGAWAAQIDSTLMESAIVWNPGEAGEAVADVGPHWGEFVCVERGCVGSAAIALQPGERHVATMQLSWGTAQ
ncbi:MAG: D-hexose-6-phosphate mutarotase [Burkholderiales bacterium]|nr:D-hexose-6-phosphate mutarotase [Burkholderiales bacterium]